QVLEYNAPGGKYNRGLTLLAAFRELVEPERQDPESFQCALTVGWCIELLQACFLVADDIMDDSLTRRGQPCWDKQEGIGLDAVNDSFLLEACIYQLLKKYCRGRPYYLNLLELFLQTSYQTELGQALDLMRSGLSRGPHFPCARGCSCDAVGAAFALVAAAFALVVRSLAAAGGNGSLGGSSPAWLQLCSPSLSGGGRDAGCSSVPKSSQGQRLLCRPALTQCPARIGTGQARLTEENYGQKDAAKVAKVKELYEAVGMRAAYQECEESSYRRLEGLGLPRAIFLGLAQKIYKRQK
uniref:Farnesyl pyrophosphate synthase n=1 Tax=Pelodiscus sinensis TaxID=13735 RepID=K7FC94_PELSI